MNWRLLSVLSALAVGCGEPLRTPVDALDVGRDVGRDGGGVGSDSEPSPRTDLDTAPSPDVGTVDAAGAADAIDGADAALPEPALIELGAANANLSNDFTATVSGATAGRIGAVALTDNIGTVEIDGQAWPAFANERQAWPDFGLTLVQTLVVTDDALYPMWLYCSGSTFDGVYFESTDGTPMTWEPASSGSCAVTESSASGTVSVPAVRLAVPAPDHAFRVDGGPLVLEPGQHGSFGTATATWQVYPFEVVDCTVDCGTPGWWELHSLLWDGANACFSIFYFFVGRDSQVSYSTCLPRLDDAVGAQPFGGSWSL